MKFTIMQLYILFYPKSELRMNKTNLTMALTRREWFVDKYGLFGEVYMGPTYQSPKKNSLSHPVIPELRR